MKRLCLDKLLGLFLFIVGVSHATCVSFFYGDNPPVELLYSSDIVVLEPEHVDRELLKGIETYNRKSKVLGYISIGEVEKHRIDKTDLKWILGKNRNWDSYIADIRNPSYRKYLLQRIKKIYQKGFDGVFLDTIDSYQRIFDQKEDRLSYEKGLVSFIKNLKESFPDKVIAINRGFEIYNKIKDYIDLFVIENLFTYYSPTTKQFKTIPEKERSYILKLLQEIKKNTDVVVIEYVKPEEKEKAYKLIEKIEKLGFIPFVSNYNLSIIGYNRCTPEPRRILLLYNSDYLDINDPVFSYIHRNFQLFAEYFGLIPEFRDVNSPLPEGYIADRYYAIVSWVSDVPEPANFHRWILDKINQGIKVVFIDSFGFPPEEKYLKPLGIKVYPAKDKNWKLKKGKWFEIEPLPSEKNFSIYPENGNPIFLYKNNHNQTYVPASITQWGGYALEGTYLRNINYDFYVINPFEFVKNALKIDRKIPIPDTTTESGRRILYVHIDGDGFNQKSIVNIKKYTYASEVIEKEIIEKFQIPHSVSIIEGEIAPWGAYPNQNHEKLEKIARDLLLKENVEPASHSFSHPFNWYGLYNSQGVGESNYNLKIKNYRFSLKREIEGSTEYIKNRILEGKKGVKLFFWTGDCIIPMDALKLTYKVGLYNINGGDTTITTEKPFLSLISPLGINKGKYFQLYAQIQNDNVYTENFAVPYRYKKVIETFKLTDKNYRLKPIDIYYHFFSGSLPSSLKALKEVYSWALSQEVIPVYTSDYTKIAFDLKTTTIRKEGSDTFTIKNNGSLRTIRFEDIVDIDIKQSKGVAGYRHIKGRTYVSLDGTGEYKVKLGKGDNNFHLVSSNARVMKVETRENRYSILLKGYLPVEAVFFMKDTCKIKTTLENAKTVKIGANKIQITFKEKEAKIDAVCR